MILYQSGVRMRQTDVFENLKELLYWSYWW